MTPTPDIDAFIARWAASGAAERANFQSFANELCDLLGVAKPLPAGGDAAADAYVFEKPVPLAHGTTGFIDLYRRGCFVMEAKQGSAGAQGSGVQRTAESAAPDAGGLGGGASEADSTDWSLKSAQSAQSADDPSFVETILERLVALNAARAAEEACGVVRWLRPAYQMPRAGAAEPAASQPALLADVETGRRPVSTTPGEAAPWPDGLAARAAAVRAALVAFGRPATAAEVAGAFAGQANRARLAAVGELLPTLVALGQARAVGEGRFVAGS